MKLNSYKFFILIVFITIFIYYSQHIRFANFVFEDINWITTPKFISLRDFFVIPGNRITLLTFAYNTPFIAHIINLIIHIINAFLLSMLIEFWFEEVGWIIGSLFLINPLTIQAVAYASGRGELLSLTFLLGFLWSSTKSELNYSTRWILIIVCVLCIASTKATTFIISIPLFLWIYYNVKYINFIYNFEYYIYFFFFISPMIIWYNYLNILTSQISISRWFLIQNYATYRLLCESITGQGLSIDHAWWLVSQKIQVLCFISTIIIIISLLIKKSSLFNLGLGWWFISFSPRLFAHVNLGWIREHHAYVPLVGVCIIIGSFFREKNEDISNSFDTRHLMYDYFDSKYNYKSSKDFHTS